MMTPPLPFSYADAYWSIETQAGGVYSSKSNTLVSPSDTDFVAWKELHGEPTSVPDEATLWPAMQHLADWLFNGTTFVQPAEGEYTKVQLAAYSAMKRYEAEVAGTTVNSQPVRTDRVSRAAVNAANEYLNSAGAPASINWKTLSGFVAWSKNQTGDAVAAINSHVQASFDTEKQTLDGINGGSITTLEQIDAVYAPAKD